MDLGLKGRAAAVAASSQGLGFACALELAREGAGVAICSRSRERIDAAAGRIRDALPSARVHPVVVDVSDRTQCEAFINETAAEFGRLDILVTNTGGPAPGALDEVSYDMVDAGYHSTLMSAIAMMRTAAGHMRDGGWGRIVNIVSVTVKQPRTSLLVSNTMRPAILGFAKSISNELASSNITVNNVAPGYTRTERLDELAGHLAKTRKGSEKAVFEEWERTIPAGRLGAPEELAAVVAFLASERAGYVTGVTVQVDGGSVQGLF
jgi:3-oxoacyl-[acyl-carrier protein] reductase